ncbi:IclR family transcriptional regulator [Mycolicibacterium sp. CBM1]
MARDTNTSTKIGNDSGGIQSVARALSVLEVFEERRSVLTTNEIASMTGLNRGTAYRFCQTLKSLGYLEEIRQSTFRPGLKVLSLAQAALSSRELVDVAMPRLQALRHDTGETVNFAMPDGAEVVYMARLLNDDLLALRLVVGSRLPMVSSSLGRSMLAFMADEAVDAVVAASKFEKLTDFTVTDAAVLYDELARIRKVGYAFNDQEIAVGVRGIAAPILGSDGRPVAAVNLSIARPVKAAELKTRLAPQLLSAAEDIGKRARQMDRFA